MAKHFLIFGSHPLLSLAETRAVIGGTRPELADRLAIIDRETWDGISLQERLSGVIKLGDIILELPVNELTAERLADELLQRPRAERVLYGLTIYGGSPTARQKTERLALRLKRVLQERGKSVRWVTGDEGEISPAAVQKLKLTSDGYDLVIGLLGTRAVVGLTTHVQNADAWSLRDYSRPFRDTKTGMLPPKLARMMVNLMREATEETEVTEATVGEGARTLLDPFCGAGTILMEAGLLGAGKIMGSDIDERQVAGAKINLDWLVETGHLSHDERESIALFVSAAEHLDQKLSAASVAAIVTEGYLGEPLNGQETLKFLQQQKTKVETIWKQTLPVLFHVLKPGGRIVCVWPVYRTVAGTVVVDLKTEAAELGFRLLDPLEAWTDKPVTLTYGRSDQHVKRNIIVMDKPASPLHQTK